MTKETIIKELKIRGYEVETHEVIKNSVKLEGLVLKSKSQFSPVIYLDDIIKYAEREEKSIEETVSYIVNIYENSEFKSFDLDDLKNKDFILNHLYIGLQKKSNEILIKKAYEQYSEIECYLYIRVDDTENNSASAKVKMPMLENAGITEDEAWEYAKNNTYNETEFFTFSLPNLEFVPGVKKSAEQSLYILTNKSKCKGASAILNRKYLESIAHEFNVSKIVAIPSSIHEFLILPYEKNMDLKEFNRMVKEVNFLEVDEIEQLANEAFIINI